MKTRKAHGESHAAYSFIFLFAVLTLSTAALADPLGANTGAIYRMGPDGYFQEGCFDPCLCPITLEQRVLGTLKLVYLGQVQGIHEYAVEDVNFHIPTYEPAERIIGSGRYRIGSPDPITLLQQRMELDLRVGEDAVQHFDSGWVPYNKNSGIDVTVSINGMFCWDRVIRISASPVPASQLTPYSLLPGSTFQRGCFDPCDCLLGPQVPMFGEHALVPLENNSLFQLFAVVNVRWRAHTSNAADPIPLHGFGLYWVGGEFAAQNRLSLELIVGDEERHHFDSGWAIGGGQFPHIDIFVSIHGMFCFDTVLHVITEPSNGELCGGFAGIPCENPNEFCKLPPGHCCCDFFGVCTEIPETCPEYVDLVCGCDGVTYDNPCFADAAGASIDYWGRCRQSCGGPNDPPCAADEFCKHPLGTCGQTNVTGLCTMTGGSCPAVWDPVCGCNGITYSNECEADSAGVSVRHHGICEDPCQPTPDGSGCTSCFSDIPEDGCRASVLHLDVHTGAITTLDCDCMNMSACHIEFGNASPHAEGNCPPGETCEVVGHDTDNDGVDDTFSARCMSSHVGACCFDIDDGPVPYDTCTPMDEQTCGNKGGLFGGFNTACSEVQACCLPGFVSGNGLCAELNPFCCIASGGVPQGPGSSCEESSPCGEVCGGFAGIPCDNPDEFCKLPIGQCCCDHFGMCTPIPPVCPPYWDPVCGCDGLTYGNECEADAAGVSIDHRGPCGQPTCSATRVLNDPNGTHCAGLTNHVRIVLGPPNATTAIAVEDSPPAGWAVSNISNGGHYDAVNHKVKWGPFFPLFPPEVSYDTTPSNDANAPQCFTGTISIDGTNEPICGDQCLDPCCPKMASDLSHGGCPMCPVSDCNSCNASICGDGQTVLCELVGYACSWLHGCHDDISGVTRAAYIWRNGECYCWDDGSGNWYPTECPPPATGCCEDGDTYSASPTDALTGGATMQFDSLSDRSALRGTARRVWVDIEAPDGTSAAALEVNVPTGWKVTSMTDGGRWDGTHGKVKWGPFVGEVSRTVMFEIHAESDKREAKGGRVTRGTTEPRWSGTVSFDGVNRAIDH